MRKYSNYKRNHAIPAGSEKSLKKFINQTYPGLGAHKKEHSLSSNSEDALTWSLFESINSSKLSKRQIALREIIEDAYDLDKKLLKNFPFPKVDFKFDIGRLYKGASNKEFSEIDASLELENALIFIEAKLYSPLSPADPGNSKPYDQIERKLRIGMHNSTTSNKEFYFIFLDIAPLEKLYKRAKKEEAVKAPKGFHEKWKTAWLYDYYKNGRNNSLKPLKLVFESRSKDFKEIEIDDISNVSKRMGWLTWSDLTKITLRSLI